MAKKTTSPKRPFMVEYFVDGRASKTRSGDTKGFPKSDFGALRGAGWHLFTGMTGKVRVTDRRTGKVKFEAVRTADGSIRKTEFE